MRLHFIIIKAQYCVHFIEYCINIGVIPCQYISEFLLHCILEYRKTVYVTKDVSQKMLNLAAVLRVFL